MVLLGWLYMADILENPFGFNKQYDINLDEVDSDQIVNVFTKTRSWS